MRVLCSLTALAVTFALSTSFAFAREGDEGNLHVSGGISMPATSTSVFSNPAGMVSAKTSLVLQAGAPEVWESGTYRAGLQTGGSSFGVAAGLEQRDRTRNDPLLAYYGVAVGSPAFSLGLAGRTGIADSDGTSFNAGVLFGVGSAARVGITARDLDDGVNEWGAGVAFGLNEGVDLVLDAAADDDLNNLEIKPGVKVGSDQVALTLSYATGPRQQFADDFTAGVSFQVASASLLEIQYNAGGDLSKYFAAFTLGF